MVKLLKFMIVAIGSMMLVGCAGGGGGDDGDTTITHNGTDYETVTSPYTGEVWLDRNLGAAQVCTSYNDVGCYGDYYQWGRNFDGHEDSASPTNATLATQIDPVQPAVDGEFITINVAPRDWTAGGVDDSGAIREAKWSQVNGTNVCPTGFRVPTITELRAELLDNPGSAMIDGNTPSADKRDNAFATFLKLPAAGSRGHSGGSMFGVGGWGYLWASSVGGAYSHYLYWHSGAADWNSVNRAYGFSVRCLRD